jgi:transforming growth factor-beta-induced protein
LLAELQVSGLADIDAATLEAVLEYHVANGNKLESDLSEGMMVPTVQGGSFTVSLMGGAKITDGAGRETNIIVTDLQGGNGVVHAVDRVLLPS